jgi:hypothetical protein
MYNGTKKQNLTQKETKMKRYLFAALVVALLGLAVGAQAAVVFTENFEYDAGVLGDSTGQANVSGGVWHHFSGTQSLITCDEGNLSFANYQASGIGRMMRMYAPSGSAEDLYSNFTSTITAGTPMYASFLLNVLDTLGIPRDTSTNGEYFVSFLPSTSTTMYAPRLIIRQGTTANTYVLGIRPSGTTNAIWNTTAMTPATTYLIVLRHVLVAGSGNDTASLFIDPDMTSPEPSPTLTGAATSADTTTDLGRFAVRQNRQNNSTRTPNANLDGMIVGTTWQDITGVAGAPAAVPASGFTLQVRGPNPMSQPPVVEYTLPRGENVSLNVFNMLGQKVATLASGRQSAGAHQVRWSLRGDDGAQVRTGIYFFQLNAGTQSSTRKMVVVR